MKNQILRVVDKIFKTNYAEKEVPPYPTDFALIDFSPIAKQNGIKDNQNKLIYRYYHENGNLVVKKYRYSVHRVKALKEVHNLPVFDKTKVEDRFPVHARILPSEITYTK